MRTPLIFYDVAPMRRVLLLCATLALGGTAAADPCTQISRQFASGLQEQLPAGTLIYGPQAYPSIPAESLVFVPARPQTDMVEITINGSERIDLRAAYIRTGKMQFRSLAGLAGCDLYDQPEFVDFSKTTDLAVKKPSLSVVSYCSGDRDRARLISVQDAFLFHTTGDPYCVMFQKDLFDPFGLAECSKEKSQIAPWESVKEISVLVRAPSAASYTLDVRLTTTVVSDERCIGCYPEIDCKALTSDQTTSRKMPVDFTGPNKQAVVPLSEILALDFEHQVTAFDLRVTLSLGPEVLEKTKVAPEWPRCC